MEEYKSIMVQHISFRDGKGKVRGFVNVGHDGIQFTLCNKAEKAVIDMAVTDKHGPEFSLYGPERAQIRIMLDRKGNPCITLSKGDSEHTFSIKRRL
jgi:hypothetical protein